MKYLFYLPLKIKEDYIPTSMSVDKIKNKSLFPFIT